MWRCPCGGPLDLVPSDGLERADVDTAEPSFWRYQRALQPLQRRPVAYFAEGMTPLVRRSWGGRALHFKLDFFSPTGSFKDRGAALVVNHLAERGVRAMRVDSSGNAGAAAAAYGTAAGIRCLVFVPRGTSPGKLAQIRAYGARVIQVEGGRDSVAGAAMAPRAGSVYAGHNWHPLFIEGVKTLGYELWEQGGWAAPDVVVTPVGAGSGLLGLCRSFGELQARGSISRLPRVYAAQTVTFPAIHRAFAGIKPRRAVGVTRLPSTIAEGLAITQPVRGDEIVGSLRRCGGRVALVTEAAVGRAVRDLARVGLYVEPSAAVGAAATRQLVAAGEIATTERVVVILTGSGLKTPQIIAQLRS